MANQQHLEILKQGVEVWNEWREKYPDIWPDLRGANLKLAKLSGVDLSGAKLGVADLKGADLREANLWKANLIYTDLNGADLWRAKLDKADLDSAKLGNANLREASLWDAYLWGTNLKGADLREANLQNVSLGYASLKGADRREANLKLTKLWSIDLEAADLSGAMIAYTVFGDVDLSTVKGLDAVIHRGPSTIGLDTIYRSKGNIPETFLQGAGIDNTFITYNRSLIGKPIDYYSCFISYSSRDEALAKRLYTDLQINNVRCWFAPEDLKWGERIRSGIDEAIHFHDKLLLILSKYSVASGWVEHEVKTAIAKERKEKRIVLFPVRLDKAVLESPLSWATEIRHERNIGDFNRWKNHNEYQKALTRLLRDLKTEPSSKKGK